jgi:putative DNA primase/helicase
VAERGPAGTWQYLAMWDAGRGRMDLGATLAALPADDLSAAFLLSAERPGEMNYADGPSRWHIWNGMCHAPDDSRAIGRVVAGLGVRAEHLLERCRAEVAARELAALEAAGGEVTGAAARSAADAAWKRWEGPARYLAGLRRAAGAGALARIMMDVLGVSEDYFTDRRPYWMNTVSGTVSMETLEVKPHDPADRLAYCLSTAWVPGARCPRFMGLLRRAAGGDEEVASYLMRVLGYCLIGSNPEQQIFFISGPSASGKSVLLEIVAAVLEGLAHESQVALITVQRHGRNARTENSIRGRRYLPITETSAFMTVDEGQVKRLTGERVISVDRHYALEELRTPVTFTIVVATNQMPVLTSFDAAMRRRVVVIPGGDTIPEELRDRHLADRILAEEKEGILACLLAAAHEYLRTGRLPQPLAVRMRTDVYQSEQDTVAGFIAESCDMAAGAATEAGVLWRAYQEWARGSGRLGRNEFYDQLAQQPGVLRVRNEYYTVHRFEGLRMKAPDGSGLADAWSQAAQNL